MCGVCGTQVNLNCIMWTLFVTVIFSIPTVLPVTKDTMNYAAVITGSVVILAGTWFVLGYVSCLLTAPFRRSHRIDAPPHAYMVMLADFWSTYSAHRHYHGPQSNLHEGDAHPSTSSVPEIENEDAETKKTKMSD